MFFEIYSFWVSDTVENQSDYENVMSGNSHTQYKSAIHI